MVERVTATAGRHRADRAAARGARRRCCSTSRAAAATAARPCAIPAGEFRIGPQDVLLGDDRRLRRSTSAAPSSSTGSTPSSSSTWCPAAAPASRSRRPRACASSPAAGCSPTPSWPNLSGPVYRRAASEGPGDARWARGPSILASAKLAHCRRIVIRVSTIIL